MNQNKTKTSTTQFNAPPLAMRVAAKIASTVAEAGATTSVYAVEDADANDSRLAAMSSA